LVKSVHLEQNVLARNKTFLPGTKYSCLQHTTFWTRITRALLISKDRQLFVTPYLMVGSLKMNTALEYSTRVVQEGDRRCKKSTLNYLAYLTPLRIPLMNPVFIEQNFSLCDTEPEFLNI
jgi:hypothetical protein